jgi:hypothetical protein
LPRDHQVSSARGLDVKPSSRSTSYAGGRPRRCRDLERGTHPRGWKADVRYVPSSENRSHGSTLGIKLRRFCDDTRFRYVFY